MTDAWRLSATEAARLLAARELSSAELVTACLDRIEAREPELRAWAHLDPEAALAQARERDAEAARGPLHGLPVGVKDVIDTADLPTEYGSPIYARNRPRRDADCVAWLRDAGAVVLGKTVTT
jgi:Asp-tRNA(Asn)/Glu-tRNA(Gln) amidotransferase A subunit family amidase